MQILVQSLENSKPKILDNTPLWFISSNKPSLANYIKEQNIPKSYTLAFEYLIHNFCLNDNYIFTIEELETVKKRYPFYKEFCYLNKFPFEDYENSKNEDEYQDWYHNELAQNVISDYDYFHDLIVNDSYMSQLNSYYQDFLEYIKQLHSIELQKHLRVRHLLKKESDWLNSMKASVPEDEIGLKLVKSLNKYSIAVGLDFAKNTNPNSKARAQIEKFIPAGMCFYDKYIFVNTYHYSSPHKALKNKINSKELFAHELGHVISFVRQDMLKHPASRVKYCQDHPELKTIVKKTWHKFQIHKLTHFQKKYLKYFVIPEQLKGKLNWDRPCEETFAECFGYVFDIVLNGFSPSHVYYKKDRKGMMAFHMKNMAPAVLWVLDNLKWELVFPQEKNLALKLKKIKHYFSNVPEPIADRNKRLKVNLSLIKYSPKNMKNFTYLR